MRKLHFGAFEVLRPQVGATYSWAHPLSDSINFKDPQHWIKIARILEDSGFDFLFFADDYGYPIIGDDVSPTAVAKGINFSGLEPSVLIPLLAQHTSRLGFVVTSATGFEHPVQLARRFASLDEFTSGRIGWNVVTGASQNALAELFGHKSLVPHDVRYDMAAEYLALCNEYWENNWSDTALIADKESGIYADYDELNRVEFEGEYYRSSGHFGVPPTPQRTPVLFQAGTSPKGKAFAAEHAECVFVQGTTVPLTAANVTDIREKTRQARGSETEILLLAGLTAFVADTEEEAKELAAQFDEMQTDQIVASMYAGNTGIDLLSLDPDQPLTQILDKDGPVGQMGVSNIERFLGKDGGPKPTVREILDQLRGRGTRGFRVVGTGAQVADQIEELAEATDLNGFLLEPVYDPRDLEAFGRLVMPELRQRGSLPELFEGATLREQVRQRPGSTRLR